MIYGMQLPRKKRLGGVQELKKTRRSAKAMSIVPMLPVKHFLELMRKWLHSSTFIIMMIDMLTMQKET